MWHHGWPCASAIWKQRGRIHGTVGGGAPGGATVEALGRQQGLSLRTSVWVRCACVPSLLLLVAEGACDCIMPVRPAEFDDQRRSTAGMPVSTARGEQLSSDVTR